MYNICIKGGCCIMATNSNDDREVRVDLTQYEVAQELQRIRREFQDQNPTSNDLFANATGDEAGPSQEQKPKSRREQFKEQFKEKLSEIKAIFKNGTGREKLAFIGKAIGAGLGVLAVVGSLVVGGIGIKARVDFDRNLTSANSIVADFAPETQVGTMTEMLNYIINSDSATQEEKNTANQILSTIEILQQEGPEYMTKIEDAESYKLKNVFKADQKMDDIINELVQTKVLSEYEQQVTGIYNSVYGRDQGAQGQANSTNQQIAQNILNGTGSYYNLTEIQSIMQQINQYFVDADGNGIADIEDIVNLLTDSRYETLASSALESMKTAKGSADSLFATLSSNWATLTGYTESGDYATAIAYYNNNIASSVSNLTEYLTTVKNSHDSITQYAELVSEQPSQIQNSFSEADINQHAELFKGKTNIGNISSVNYTYETNNGKVTVVVNGTHRENPSYNTSAIYTYYAQPGLENYDIGSVVNGLSDKTTSISKKEYINSGTINATVSVSNNGQTSQVSSDYIKGYTYTTQSIGGTIVYKISAVLIGENGSVINLNVKNITLDAGTKMTQERIDEAINEAISSSTKIQLNHTVENVNDYADEMGI